ncbi:MAG: polysaccharide biosynthesis/export family protein [Planctomycetota bacterium]
MNINLLQTRLWKRLASTFGVGLLLTSGFTGCTSLTQNIDGIPAHRLPPEFFPPPKNNLVPVDVGLLALEPPRDYQLDSDDILGIYIEGVLPFNPPNAPPEPPPVNFPEEDSTLPPSIGYPIAVQNDGTLALPLIEPLEVRGLTLDQLRDKIRDAYINEDILRPEKARPIVTLIKERTYDVIVVREDGLLNRQGIQTGGAFIRGIDDQATGGLIKLAAYENDILHALVETGGLPGLNAKNEVQILRASQANKRKRAEFLRQFYASQAALAKDPCYCPPEIPEDPNILRIPLRVPPGVVPNLTEADVTLREGDIVFVQNRETEVFYTGGLLPGGEFPLPRDYDLDVLGAMAIAGGGVVQGQNGQSFGFAGVGTISGVAPGLLYILRRTPCNGQVAIEVDLGRAINDPRSRPLVQPGDTLILQYSCEEEAINFGISTFFTFGIQELFQNN